MTLSTYEATLSGYKQGFHVRHIATFNISTCQAGEEVRSVLSSFPDFDQIPVKKDGRIIGILERNGSGRGEIVLESMRRLDDGILVAADEPLINFIPLMSQHPYYRLVLDGSRVDGVVTRSDLLKLPVRLLAFALVTNLELVMKEIIIQRSQEDEDWLNLLSPNRRLKVENKRNNYAERRMEPPLIELTDFCDKRTIVKKMLGLEKSFENDLIAIEDLRNTLAHAGTYIEDEASLQQFIENLENAQKWINQLG